MTLQAGNWKTRGFIAPQKDNSEAITFQVTNNLNDDAAMLTIEGVLPIAESTYLISKSSLCERVGALNYYDTGGIGSTIGLPFLGTSNTFKPVILPAGVPGLSGGNLILERRLAFLLTENIKLNNFYRLINFMHYVNLISTIRPVTYNPLTGGVVLGVESLLVPVINLLINSLFYYYPKFKEIIPLTGTPVYLDEINDWIAERLADPYLISIPRIEYARIIEETAEQIELWKDYRNQLRQDALSIGGATATAASDTSAAIVASPIESTSTLSIPDNFNNSSNNSILSSPIESPVNRSYEALTADRPINTLPEC